ncbi:T9SS type A sorting domain-containing protein [Longitalea arenae]|uniref:T9SS type A sorting domain-containing protein n=1 Tax=Longitalea arenae TaxID=2812558 RepID=UPI00196775B4|nr:T9SS type A sorting domain-containing protein [Longitalea arenae]
MKSIYTTLVTLLITANLMAGNITASNGDWDQSTTWTPSRLPQSGDSIIIPFGKTVLLDRNIDLDNVVVIVKGTLDMDGGKLRMNDASRIIVDVDGKITGINHDDQVRIGNVLKFNGSQGVQTGYSYADNSTGNGFVTTVVLPVQFQSFYVTRQGANVQVSFTTSEELNNQYYAIERSADARNWKQLAIISGAGTSNLVNKYSYTDKNITDAVVYYRIRQVDRSGVVFYSAIRSLRNSENSQLANIYASSNKTVTIDFNSDVKDKVSIQLINLSGQVVVRKEFHQASYRLIVDAMSAGSGVYVVRVSDSKGWSEVKKIML